MREVRFRIKLVGNDWRGRRQRPHMLPVEIRLIALGERFGDGVELLVEQQLRVLLQHVLPAFELLFAHHRIRLAVFPFLLLIDSSPNRPRDSVPDVLLVHSENRLRRRASDGRHVPVLRLRRLRLIIGNRRLIALPAG